jgi:hypothetical protein
VSLVRDLNSDARSPVATAEPFSELRHIPDSAVERDDHFPVLVTAAQAGLAGALI